MGGAEASGHKQMGSEHKLVYSLLCSKEFYRSTMRTERNPSVKKSHVDHVIPHISHPMCNSRGVRARKESVRFTLLLVVPKYQPSKMHTRRGFRRYARPTP